MLVAEPAAVPSGSPVPGAAPHESIAPTQTLPILAFAISWSKALKSCALAALVATVLMFLGLHPFVAMPSAGFLAVVFYRQGQENLPIRQATGIRLGAFGGLLYFGLIAVFTSVAAVFPEPRAKLHETILDSVQQFATSHSDNPQVQEMLKQIKTPDGFVLWLIVCGVALLVASIVLGGLGGVVGGTIFGRRGRG
ncbi:MAG TPA: hypothetical protein VMU05_11915 [Dongiaceae bacterium]|nr:hypothetical protein [Dongiaceae bacterium]